MKTIAITAADLEGVFAVPPLARARDASRSIDFTENDRIVRHISAAESKGLSTVVMRFSPHQAG